MKYILRKAQPQDAKTLTEIAKISKQYWGYSTELIKAWEEELTVTENFIKDCIGFVIEENNSIKGFWCRSATEELADGFLFVEPRSIGLGYGRILWNAVMQEAKNLGLKYLTWESDPNATNFYKKMGAKQIGTKPSAIVKGRFLPIMRYYLK
ncbi:MAG: GNAT family N-acetyltransferase [Legionellales bacterium]|nr:GNAT family N-acetyltransferase [Legionellales bacterium]